MQLEIYQWLGPIIALYYIVRTVKQYSKGKYSPRNTIIWLVFWTGISLLAIMPDRIANSLAKGLGFRDHINAIIFVALALLVLFVFYLSAALNRVENQLTDLIRAIALKEGLQSANIQKSTSKQKTKNMENDSTSNSIEIQNASEK